MDYPRTVRSKHDEGYALRFGRESAARWEDLGAAVKVNGAWVGLADFPKRRWMASARGGTLLAEGAAPLEWFRLDFDTTGIEAGVVLKASARAATDARLGGFRLMCAEGLSEAFGGKGEANQWVLYIDEFRALGIGALFPLSQLREPARGAWMSALHHPGKELTIGWCALTAKQWPTWFEWSPGKKASDPIRFSVRAGGMEDCEEVLVRAGETVESDPVLVGCWRKLSGPEVLCRLADEVSRWTPRKPARRPEPGWCSWMYHAGAVTEEDVLRAADALRARFFSAGYRMIQVDGGWWTRHGDWRPNDKFPHGLRWLSDQVHERGLLFGVHFSPFFVDQDSAVARDHPDWLVRSCDGSRYIRHKEDRKDDRRCILDTSHPKALKWLGETAGRMAREWGLDYIKLDFLNAGAREGRRHDPSMTGLAAYRRALEAIRRKAPRRVKLLGCNLLTLGGWEHVDSVRVGPDINRVGLGHVGPRGEYANMKWGPEEGRVVLEGGPAHQTLAGEARAVARHFHAHGRLCVNDADAVLVTPDYSLEEARAHVTLVALTGGALFLGDRLDTLPENRAALVTHAPLLRIWREGKHAEPLDLFSGREVPEIWKLIRRNGNVVVALFNWSDHPKKVGVGLKELGTPPEATRWTDVWTGQEAPPKAGRLAFDMPAHSVRLVEGRGEL